MAAAQICHPEKNLQHFELSQTQEGSKQGFSFPAVFIFNVGLRHRATASICCHVQQQKQLALLDWSQQMVAANKYLHLSDLLVCYISHCGFFCFFSMPMWI